MITSTSLLQDLVRLPSVNPMGQTPDPEICFEHRVTDYLEKLFQGWGVEHARQTIAPQRENIIARYASTSTSPTLVLEVHQDTVPVRNMTIPPFGGVLEGGKVYGRGSCDIKGGMAAMLMTLARVARERPARCMNLILACTVDEEHTFKGITRFIESGLKADFAIVAEPTRLDIVHSHKGATRWHLSTTGRSCHSSRPDQGINAIYRMGKILVSLDEYARELSTTRKDPLLGPATLSVGIISGGSSVNTVPDRCTIEIDRRLIPGEKPEEATQHLTRYLQDRGGIDFPFDFSDPWLKLPALSPELSASLVSQFGQSINAVRGQHEVIAVPYGTDASPLAEAGIPTVVFGPGEIAQAHTCDEWIEIEQIEMASEILFHFITHF